MDLQREETRKIYDHYEKKLEKLNEEKEKKIKRGAFQENSTFAKKLERVINKYKKLLIVLHLVYLINLNY